MYKDLPFVTFEYPDSETDYLKIRYLRVKSMDQTHIKGYEFTTARPSATDEGKLKTYLLAKIVNNGVHLVSFEPPLAA